MLAEGFKVPNSLVVGAELSLEAESNKILQLAEQLGATKLAVRSSANFEDLLGASFAGLFKSFLNVERKNLLATIKDCRAAAKREAVFAYCQAKKIDPQKIKLTVLVQEMIDCQFSGVLFSQNPLSGQKDVFHLEFAEQQEGVTAGNSENFCLKFKKENLELLEGNLPVDCDFLKLLKEVLRLEKLFSGPIDMEWGYDGQDFWIFQLREVA